MSGKATLLVVAGFSLIFLVLGKNLGSISTRAVDNSVEYYNQTIAHELAVSAANLAATQIFFDNTWNAGFSNLPLKGGEINATVQTLDIIKNTKKITASATYPLTGGTTHTVEVVLAPSSFSKFAYMSTDDPTNLYWTNADTIYGPFHSQGNINAAYHPVFWGKATTKGNVNYLTSEAQDKPYFYGGFENGVDLPISSYGVSNLETIASTNGTIINLSSGETLYLTFKQDSISLKVINSSGTILSHQSVSSYMYNNKIIFVKGGDIKMQGTVKGQFTVGTDKSVYLEDDVVYSSDPRTNPNSTDILGIVAKQNVLITENTANKTNGINIHASIYCETGGFGAGWPSFPANYGKINLLGGIQNRSRVQIGIINGGGFTRAYRYDNRLALMSPPFYPGTGEYEIVSWQE